MDIGNQQRVIIVDLHDIEERKPEPALAEVERSEELEQAVTWPLPLDLDPAPVS